MYDHYILVFERAKVRMSVAPISWSSSIFVFICFLLTKHEIALKSVCASAVIFGDFFPGVNFNAFSSRSL